VKHNEEMVSGDPPPPNTPGPYSVKPKGVRKLVYSEHATSVYAYVPIVNPFRIKIRGFKDITNLTVPCEPYAPGRKGLPLSKAIKDDNLMKGDYVQLCFPLVET
tara:strand:+ start:117 stop:428 length:312 start_codon:yes stop_codon:yes gene_type:complete